MICGSGNSYLEISYHHESDNKIYKDAEIQMLFLPHMICLHQILVWVEQAAACEGWWELQHEKIQPKSHGSSVSEEELHPGSEMRRLAASVWC